MKKNTSSVEPILTDLTNEGNGMAIVGASGYRTNRNEKRARGTGSLRLRGNVWHARYYVHGRRIDFSTGESDPKKAEKMLKRKLAQVVAGVHDDARNIRYEHLRSAFYNDYEIKGRKSLRRDKDGNPYLDKVARLDGFFSGWRASEIDADAIRKFIAEEQAKGLANASINRSVSALRRMFSLAREDDKLRSAPHFPMLKEPAPRQGWFEREQYEALSVALPAYLRLPLALGYYTGMRLGEILGLEWDQVDLLADTISLRAGETKNDAARTIPVVPQLRGLLLEHHAKRQPECQFVCFRLDRGGKAVRIGSFRKAWQSRCVRLGLGEMSPATDRRTGSVYRGLIFHDLRRTAVRNLVGSQVPERVAMAISGHKTRSVFDRYHIVSPKDVAEAGRKLAAFHEKNGGKTGAISEQASSAPSRIN